MTGGAARFLGWYKAAAILLLNSLTLLAGLELGARLLLRDSPTMENQAIVDRILRRESWGDQFIRDHDTFQYRLQEEPYIEFTHRPFTSRTINVGGDGFRIVPGSPPSGRELMALGGSTMLGVGAPDDGTIPAFLQTGLPTVRVLNRGIGFWISTQEAVYLALELKRGHVPDLVLFYDGVNDVARSVEYGRAGIPRQPPRGTCPAPSRFFLAALNAVRRSGVAIPERPCIDPPGYPTPPILDAYTHWPEANKQALARETVAVYLENVAFVQRLAAAYHFRPLFFWQPTLFTTRKPLSAEERELLGRSHPGYRDLTLRVDALVRAAMSTHPEIVDLSHTLDTLSGTVFEDWAHILPRGNQAVATAMSSHLDAGRGP